MSWRDVRMYLYGLLHGMVFLFALFYWEDFVEEIKDWFKRL